MLVLMESVVFTRLLDLPQHYLSPKSNYNTSILIIGDRKREETKSTIQQLVWYGFRSYGNPEKR